MPFGINQSGILGSFFSGAVSVDGPQTGCVFWAQVGYEPEAYYVIWACRIRGPKQN